MTEQLDPQQAVGLLQQFGLKEYEARCFVALSRLPQGTAKEISETSDVPRTRVYDANRVLETKGLIEVQHSNPKRFRAVSIDEAVETLRAEYEERAEKLREELRSLESTKPIDETAVTHEVWALSGRPAIDNRMRQLLDEAEEEVILVVGHESVVTEALIDRLHAAEGRGVNVAVGVEDGATREQFADALPDTEVFVSGIKWLGDSSSPEDDTEIGRLLLVDQSVILVSTLTHDSDGDTEQAVFGRGFENGLVAVVRRLMATGLLDGDPTQLRR